MSRHERRADRSKARKAGHTMASIAVRGRECGACTACCTVSDIVELGKPGGVTCRYERTEPAGCGIYSRRPRCCVEYLCGWRMGIGRADERPDVVGYVLGVSEDNIARQDLAYWDQPRDARLAAMWLKALDIVPGAGSRAIGRLTEIAQERGSAVAAEIGLGKWVAVGPQAAAFKAVADERTRRRLPMVRGSA